MDQNPYQPPEGEVASGQPAIAIPEEGFLSRLAGVVMEPGLAFTRIAKQPDWLRIVLLVTIVSAVAGYVTFS